MLLEEKAFILQRQLSIKQKPRIGALIVVSTITHSLADYVVSTLVEHGVNKIFGYPGASIIELMSAIDRSKDIEWVLMRNEAAASLAASAHAKLTGKLSVCMATSGPGATNLITGLVDAQCDRAPVLAITGMPPTWRLGRFEFQDVDSAHLLRSVVGYSIQCDHPDQLPALLRDCIGRAEHERCVVHLALPLDIQKFHPDSSDTRWKATPPSSPPMTSLIPEKVLDDVAALLSSATYTVIAVGPSAHGSGPAIERLAAKLNSPIITSFAGKGVIDETHECSLGVLGIFGAPGVAVAQKVISHADSAISFGIEDPAFFIAGSNGVQQRKLIQCGTQSTSVTHRFERNFTLNGDLTSIADGLTKRVKARTNNSLIKDAQAMSDFSKEWSESHDTASGVHPARFLNELNDYIGKFDVVAFDIGDNAVWASEILKLSHRPRLLVSENLGAMGYCLPACIAAGLAGKAEKVIGICGDGGLQMTIGELGTAVQYGLDFVLIVFNNGILARIAAIQSHQFGSQIHNPNFAELATAYGCGAMEVTSSDQIRLALEKAIAHQGSPFVIDVHCDPEILAPMSKWEDGFTPVHFA